MGFRVLRITICAFALCTLGQVSASPQQAPEDASPAVAKGKYESNTRPLDIRLFHSLNRAGTPVLSPDQTRLLFTQSHYSQDDNKSATFINVLDIASGNITRLTQDKIGLSFSNPLWFDDSTFGYLHKGSIYSQPLQSGVNGSVVYTPPVGISTVSYRKDTGLLAFIASVYPDADLQKTSELEAAENKKIDSAQIYNSLWIRHWNEWMTLEKPNVFVVPVAQPSDGSQSGSWSAGKEVNLMQSLPPFRDPLIRWYAEDYVIDSKGKRVAFVTRNPSDDMTWGTNVDIYLVDTDGKSKPKLLTGSVHGIAGSPAFSPDGNRLAWLQMETPGYESDINRIYIHDIPSGRTTSIARDWDLTPQSLLWSADGSDIYAVTGDKGNNAIFSVSVATGKRQKITHSGNAGNLRLLGKDKLVLTHSAQDKCGNIHILDLGTKNVRQVTDVNSEKLKDVYLGPAEDFWFRGARGEYVHGWLVKPPGFDPKKKYPVAYLVHGGPQQNNLHSFSYAQWNPNMYASAGFVAVQVNFHGSPSYGQNFTDSIHLQWGGYPYEDLMKGLDYLISTRSYIDKDRLVALGASYGGYMMNWFNSQTRRFKALVNHDGMFSSSAFWYSTDELWFPEHDFGGVPFDARARQNYERWNPERFANNFATPTLFIQGEKDFRLTVDNAVGPFTLLRRKGVPARLMYFPDEDHWTNHVGNSVRWYTEVLRWITTFTNTTLPYPLEL
ncbi:alpha/beta-hydrolase [Martensiomyces pterosporus]|nr:alpha/beta-hydrolase [Martensiomyces pterosporus]